MHTIRTALFVTAGALAGTADSASISPVTSDAAHAVPLIDFNGTTGAVVETREGTFVPLFYNGSDFQPGPKLPGSAVGGMGLAEVYNPHDGYIYVFETETSGLYENRSKDHGKTWEPSWCQIWGHNDLTSAPSAVYLGAGYGFGIYVQSHTSLYAFVVDPGNGYCYSHLANNVGTIESPPVAVSWGPGRADVFGSVSGALEHFWSNDGLHFASETSFTGVGPLAVSSVPGRISAVSLAPGSLDVIASTATDVYALGYANDTWSKVDVHTPPITSLPVSASAGYDNTYHTWNLFTAYDTGAGFASARLWPGYRELDFSITGLSTPATEITSAGGQFVFAVAGGTLYFALLRF